MGKYDIVLKKSSHPRVLREFKWLRHFPRSHHISNKFKLGFAWSSIPKTDGRKLQICWKLKIFLISSRHCANNECLLFLKAQRNDWIYFTLNIPKVSQTCKLELGLVSPKRHTCAWLLASNRVLLADMEPVSSSLTGNKKDASYAGCSQEDISPISWVHQEKMKLVWGRNRVSAR